MPHFCVNALEITVMNKGLRELLRDLLYEIEMCRDINVNVINDEWFCTFLAPSRLKRAFRAKNSDALP
jgi:hypothetical protein